MYLVTNRTNACWNDWLYVSHTKKKSTTTYKVLVIEYLRMTSTIYYVYYWTPQTLYHCCRCLCSWTVCKNLISVYICSINIYLQKRSSKQMTKILFQAMKQAKKKKERKKETSTKSRLVSPASEMIHTR